ncbi:MAG: hypothetical protein IKX20_06650 [Paludibacteraceae bacterium]|nr:hypothetical protein [Paludibacteraceae bacterium]
MNNHKVRNTLLLLLALFTFRFQTLCVSAQETKQLAIFVYSDNETSSIAALRSQLTLSFLEGRNSNYSVVDRTDEIMKALIEEYQYQGTGMVRDDQLISIGNQLAAYYICVVAVTYYPQDNQYFFDGRIIDISTRQIIKNTFYPSGDKTKIHNLSPQMQVQVAKELAKQLDLYSSDQLKTLQPTTNLYVKGDNVYHNEEKLPDAEIRMMFAGTPSYDLYDKGMGLINCGYDNALILFGGGLASVSIPLFFILGVGEKNNAWMVGTAITGVCGLGMLAFGITRYPVGKAKIRKSVDLYNKRNSSYPHYGSIEYGISGSGVALTFTF